MQLTQLVTPKELKMKINARGFRARSGKDFDLRDWPTTVKPFCKSKKQHQELLEKHVEELSSLQQLLRPARQSKAEISS